MEPCEIEISMPSLRVPRGLKSMDWSPTQIVWNAFTTAIQQ